MSIDELLKTSLCDYEQRLMKMNKYEELDIVKDIVFDFIKIIDKPSLILIGKKRIWEERTTTILIKYPMRKKSRK